MNVSVLIIGATSAIAQAVARHYAACGANLFLVARNSERLQVIANDLKARGASSVAMHILDANELEEVQPALVAAWKELNSVDLALVAHGTLPNQQRCEEDIVYAASEFKTNAESVITILTGLAQQFIPQAKGTIAVIGSVAGDRGRASNYLYGSAKAAIEAFASGLRARLHKHGIHLLTIKPGFVATPMTEDLDLPSALTVSPDQVARDIVKAVEKRQDTLYTPWFWRWIMLIIKSIPGLLFKRIEI